MSNNHWWLLSLFICGVTLLVSLYCLSAGITSVFTHLFYLPVIILAYHYHRKGIGYSAILGLAYFTMAVYFGYPDFVEVVSALLRVVSFIAVAAVVAYLSRILEKKHLAYRSLSEFNESIVSNIKVFLTVLDAHGNILVWNTAAEEISNYSAGEVIGRNDVWKELYPDPEYRETVTKKIHSIIRDNRFFENFETVIRTKTGEKKIISWNTRAIPDESGTHSRFVAIGIDITDRKKDEEELRAAYEQLSGQEEELRNQYNELEESQRAIAESETKYRNIIRTALDGFCIIDTNGTFIEVNDAFCMMIGYSREEVLALSLGSIEVMETPEDIAGHMNAIMTRGEDRFETMYRRKDGRVIDVEISVIYAKSHGGRFVSFHRDISERKRTEEYIRNLSNLKEDLLGSHNLETKLKLITDGLVVIFGADFARIWIIGPGDLCDKGCIHAPVTEGPHVCRNRTSCLHLVTSSGRYTHTDGSHRRVPLGAYKIGRVAAGEDSGFVTNDVTNDTRVHDHEWARLLGLVSFAGFRIIAADGRTIGVLALFRKWAVDPWEEKLLEDLAGTAAQVIQKGKAEVALRENEERYRTLFEGAAEGILVADIATERFLFANPAICRMTGYAENELTAMGIDDLHPAKDLAFIHGEFEALSAGVKTHAAGIPVLRKDQAIVFMDIRTSVVSINGRRCNVGFFTDITERKMAEDALSRATGKLNLLNVVTFQDIQNAIFSLAGYLELDRQTAAADHNKQFLLKEIGLVQDISESLKFAEYYQNLGLKPPRWQNVQESFLMGISHLDLTHLSRKLDVGGLEIYADPLLEIVFFTLAENVLHHGQKATEMNLSFHETPAGISLVFENNGPDIPDDMKERIFERRYAGKMGMGLFLVREILSITAIAIKETGEAGKGARFEMEIPKGSYRLTLRAP